VRWCTPRISQSPASRHAPHTVHIPLPRRRRDTHLSSPHVPTPHRPRHHRPPRPLARLRRHPCLRLLHRPAPLPRL